MQVVPQGHWEGATPYVPQAGAPRGHWYGAPPPDVWQSTGSVGLPMHNSQRSHGFRHWVTCVQGGHLLGSAKSAALHDGINRTGVLTPGTVQQPKQSQPLAAILTQRSRHACDCDTSSEQESWCVLTYVESYGQLGYVLAGSHFSFH